MAVAEKKKEEKTKKRKINFRKLFKTDTIDEAFRPALKKYIQPDVVTRRQWRASFSSGSGSVDPLDFPLDQVIITHTGSPPCGSKDECTYAIRGLQKFFMALGYHDIPYNFLITTEGVIFEGRAWIDECALPAVLGNQSKILVIGVVGEKTGYRGDVKTTVDEQIMKIIDHGLKHDLIQPKFTRREIDSWHYRIIHKPDKQLSTEIEKYPIPLK